MSATNIALVKSLYAAVGRGDIKTVIAGLAPDVDWTVNGHRKDYPTFGRWKGQVGVQQFFAGVAQHQEAIEFTPKEFFATDDHVCVIGHYAWKIRKTGRSVESDWAHIFTVGNGKVVRFREFTDTAQYAEAYR